MVGLYYTFCQQMETFAHVMDLLYKEEFICDNIKNVDNQGYGGENVSDKTTGFKAILSFPNC